MEGTARIWFTSQQRAELWERWKNGQCVADIARALERRNKSGGGFMNANATSFGSTTVTRAPTAGAAVTVVMFHANEPGAQGAFVAEQILKQYSQ